MRAISVTFLTVFCALICAGSGSDSSCEPCGSRGEGGPKTLLSDGNSRFVQGKNTHPRSDEPCIRNYAKTPGKCQAPFAVILSCSDSRFPPEVLFDQGIGDLFVLRVAGNVASAEVLASIEYAVNKLNVGYIVVLGHQRCGAVEAAFTPNLPAEHLDALWMRIFPSVTGPFNDANWDLAARKNVDATVRQLGQNLRLKPGANPVIVGAYAHLEDGTVELPIR